MMSLSALLSLSLAIGGSFAQIAVGPVGNLRVYNKVIAPDGYSRSAVLVEGVYPAPLIAANKNDHFLLNVQDQLTDGSMETALTIHWHGLFQHHTNWADGTAFVTECPVIPGNSFLYDFSAPGQAGTYWYHSHFSEQYCDGLRGPLVIYDPDDPFKSMYDVDDASTVVTVSDWQHNTTKELPQFPTTISSALINGKGRYPGGPEVPLSIITVEKGKRYRMRLVSISCDPNFIVWIDGHNMTVIEADGINHEPVTVGSIQIYAGQRYSFILDASQPIDNYWINLQTGPAPVPGISTANGPVNVNQAILRYIGAPDSDPTKGPSNSTDLLLETQLHPLVNPAAPGLPYPGGVDKAINLPINFTAVPGSTIPEGNYTMNGVTYQAPPVPVLLQILNGASAQSLMPKGSVYPLPMNSTIEISFPYGQTGSLAGAPHPVHLHGHAFSVIRSAGNSTPNYVNPVQRDVVNIGNSASDNVTIRFVTDNPGPWFLHCHIDYHLNAGFAVVMAEDVSDVKSYNEPIPTAWDDLCPAYNKYNASATMCLGDQCAKAVPLPTVQY